MTSAEARIDELYQAPLDSFTQQRNALAKSLDGSEAARVRRLRKPAIVAWAINQLYWRERALFDRIRKTGEKLRSAQLGALKSGHRADLRPATDAHRKALADAVAATSRLAANAGVHPSADALVRTLEALSLTPTMSETPGRLTEPLQPAGFEALTGVPIAAARHHESSSTHESRDEQAAGHGRGDESAATVPARKASRSSPGRRAQESRAASAAQRQHEQTVRAAERRRAEATARHERELAAAARRRQAALARAEAAVARARSHEQRAREAWERARREVDEAARAAAALRDG